MPSIIFDCDGVLELQAEEVAKWHKYKTNVYTDLVKRGVMPARPGIARIVKEAHEAGWSLAVASTSHEDSVRAVLTHAVGDLLATQFAVFAGDIVPKKKPAPDIYLFALDKLNLNPAEVIVIEDSNNGLRASLAAGLKTIVTVSSFTTKEDFTGASLVVSSLGDVLLNLNQEKLQLSPVVALAITQALWVGLVQV